jgi:hypothetical protein
VRGGWGRTDDLYVWLGVGEPGDVCGEGVDPLYVVVRVGSCSDRGQWCPPPRARVVRRT